MIGYVTLGSNDVKKSAEFYDQLFEVVGASRIYDHESYVAWATSSDSVLFSITTPYNSEPASVGNGTMIALEVKSRNQVDLLHEKALSLGAVDEGVPGKRSGDYYCAYFRDLDGNKLNFHVKPDMT